MRYRDDANRCVFQCDAPLCPVETETGEGRAMQAAEIIKTKGWSVRPGVGRPMHFCPQHKD